MLKPVRTVAPTATIVSLQEAREHLRVTHTEEDGRITDIVAAADSYLDGWTGILGRCVRQQTWLYKVATLEDIRLPFPDVQSAVIHYLDSSQVEQVLPAQNYRVQNDELGGFVELVDTATQPVPFDRIDAVRIEAVYGMDAVPFAIKQAALMHVDYQYDRDNAGDALAVAATLIAPFRFRRV